MRRSRLPPHIVNHECVACALEICSHLAAHRTEADEAYLHVPLRIVAKPGRLRLSLLLLVENGLRYASRSYGRRPSRVEGQVRDKFADFVLCHAVGQRTADMHAELFRTVQSRQRRDGDKAAIALGQSRTFPDVAKQNFLGEVDKLRYYRAKSFPGIRRRLSGHGVSSLSIRVETFPWLYLRYTAFVRQFLVGELD